MTKLRPEARGEDRARDGFRRLRDQRQEAAQESEDEALRPETDRRCGEQHGDWKGKGGNAWEICRGAVSSKHHRSPLA